MPTRTVIVSNLSPNASERDLHDFFSFSGEIEYIEIQSDKDGSNLAYVTFKDPEALDTAVLLSGARIANQIVNISEVENYQASSGTHDSSKVSLPVENSSFGGAVTRAQDMMATMLARGYDLGKDAMNKAKAFDDKHRLTATVSSLDKKMGLTEKISAGTAVVNEHVKALDDRFHVSEKTWSAFVAAEQKIGDASSALMKNKYIFMSASWLTGVVSKVTKAAGEVGSKAMEKTSQS